MSFFSGENKTATLQHFMLVFMLSSIDSCTPVAAANHLRGRQADTDVSKNTSPRTEKHKELQKKIKKKLSHCS